MWSKSTFYRRLDTNEKNKLKQSHWQKLFALWNFYIWISHHHVTHLCKSTRLLAGDFLTEFEFGDIALQLWPNSCNCPITVASSKCDAIKSGLLYNVRQSVSRSLGHQHQALHTTPMIITNCVNKNMNSKWWQTLNFINNGGINQQ